MCVSARPEINACKRSYLDRNGLGGAVVGHWYHIFWPRLPSQNITPTRALLAPINIKIRGGGRFCLQRGVLTLATLARLTTSRSTYGRTVAEPPYSKASPDIHVRHLGTVCHAARRHEAATRQRLEAHLCRRALGQGAPP